MIRLTFFKWRGQTIHTPRREYPSHGPLFVRLSRLHLRPVACAHAIEYAL